MSARRRPSALASRAARRERIELLLVEDPSRSNAGIARETLSDAKTTARIRFELEREGRIEPRTQPVTPQAHGGVLLAAENGNSRALRTGLYSPRKYGPLRDEFLAKLRQSYPHEPDDELESLAVRKAQRRLLEDEIDRPRASRIERLKAIELSEKLTVSIERTLVRFAANARERQHATPEDELAQVVAEIAAARIENGGGDV